MNKNITLIGMPGAGKSTIGIILAKNISYGFLDTDVLIQINNQQSLQKIMDENGYKYLRQVEENEILKINIEKNIISTGGSAVYSDIAMNHLKSISYVIFLKVEIETIVKRIHNFDTRGIAKAKEQTFEDLFIERSKLYHKYADFIIESDNKSQDEAAEEIMLKLEELHL